MSSPTLCFINLFFTIKFISQGECTNSPMVGYPALTALPKVQSLKAPPLRVLVVPCGPALLAGTKTRKVYIAKKTLFFFALLNTVNNIVIRECQLCPNTSLFNNPNL